MQKEQYVKKKNQGVFPILGHQTSGRFGIHQGILGVTCWVSSHLMMSDPLLQAASDSAHRGPARLSPCSDESPVPSFDLRSAPTAANRALKTSSSVPWICERTLYSQLMAY